MGLYRSNIFRIRIIGVLLVTMHLAPAFHGMARAANGHGEIDRFLTGDASPSRKRAAILGYYQQMPKKEFLNRCGATRRNLLQLIPFVSFRVQSRHYSEANAAERRINNKSASLDDYHLFARESLHYSRTRSRTSPEYQTYSYIYSFCESVGTLGTIAVLISPFCGIWYLFRRKKRPNEKSPDDKDPEDSSSESE